ncbi:MAG: efflux RND transporter periplasmic adaptor subunit [Candidatus Sericytochromatia bacterium]
MKTLSINPTHMRTLGALSLALALALAGCKSQEKQAEAPAEPEVSGTVQLKPEAIEQGGVKVAPVGEMAMTEALSLPGNLQPQGDALVVVSTHSSGEVETLLAQMGDRVKAGQRLAVLTSLDLAQVQADYQAAMLNVRQGEAALKRQQALSRISREQAHARVETSRRQLLRAEKLFKDDIVSRQDYEAAQASFHQNELALSEAEVLRRDAESGTLAAELAKSRQAMAASAERIQLLGGSTADRGGSIPIVSPITGQVVSREVTRGQAVEQHAPLFKVVDASKLVALLDAPEGQAQAIKPGSRLQVSADALPGRAFSATVAAVGDVVDPATRKIAVRCTILNPDGQLRPGMYVTAKVPLARAMRLAVPEGAVQTMADKPVVFVAQGDGRFERREVETGPREGGRVAIQKGLKSGEQVVVAGAFWLKSELQKSELEE